MVTTSKKARESAVAVILLQDSEAHDRIGETQSVVLQEQRGLLWSGS